MQVLRGFVVEFFRVSLFTCLYGASVPLITCVCWCIFEGGWGAEVHVLDILAGSYNELSRHFNGTRRGRSAAFFVNYLNILRCVSR